MLGNLGYSTVSCDSSPVKVGQVGLQCSYGTIGEVYDFGFHEANDDDTFEMCVNDQSMLACKPDDQNFLKSIDQAKGKQQWSFDFNLRDVMNQNVFTDAVDRPERCFNRKGLNVFVQYSCV